MCGLSVLPVGGQHAMFACLRAAVLIAGATRRTSDKELGRAEEAGMRA
jgi:hypothetical protein